MALTPKQQEAYTFLASPGRHKLLYGGARSGKTYLFVRAVVSRAIRAPGSRHAVLRLRGNAARTSVSLDTFPKVMKTVYPEMWPQIEEHRQDGFFEFPNESQLWVAGLDDNERVEKILGSEFVTILFNECSQIPYSSILVARTRLAQVIKDKTGVILPQKAYYDLNPVGQGHWSNMEFGLKQSPVDRSALPNPDDFMRMQVNPIDNLQNLTEEFLQSLENMPARQRRRFYEGNYVTEVDGALWTFDRLEQIRVTKEELPTMQRIVVAIDPSGAKGVEDKRSDEIGIIVAGLGIDGRVYVLEDLTCRLGPSGWSRRAISAYYRWQADSIVAETNFGKAMVEEIIRTADPNVPIKTVTASRGKVVRAEPVAALYEEKIDKVRHLGRLPELEDQLCMFTTAGYTGERSPDRADALVWAVSELAVAAQAKGTAILEVIRQRRAEEMVKIKAVPEATGKVYAVGSVEHAQNKVLH